MMMMIIDAESKLFAGAPYKTKVQTWLTVHQMLDSAGKWVAEQGQLQFLAERRERLDIPDGCRQRIPRARRSHRKRAVAEGGLTCQHDDASSSAAPLFGPSYSSSSPLSANSAPCFHYCRMQLHCNTLTNCLNVPHSSLLHVSLQQCNTRQYSMCAWWPEFRSRGLWFVWLLTTGQQRHCSSSSSSPAGVI